MSRCSHRKTWRSLQFAGRALGCRAMQMTAEALYGRRGVGYIMHDALVVFCALAVELYSFALHIVFYLTFIYTLIKTTLLHYVVSTYPRDSARPVRHLSIYIPMPTLTLIEPPSLWLVKSAPPQRRPAQPSPPQPRFAQPASSKSASPSLQSPTHASAPPRSPPSPHPTPAPRIPVPTDVLLLPTSTRLRTVTLILLLQRSLRVRLSLRLRDGARLVSCPCVWLFLLSSLSVDVLLLLLLSRRAMLVMGNVLVDVRGRSMCMIL